jgi:hypothetical protein
MFVWGVQHFEKIKQVFTTFEIDLRNFFVLSNEYTDKLFELLFSFHMIIVQAIKI